MNFKTIADLNQTIKNNLYKIPSDVDLIVGIPRSGMLPATILGLYLNVPITDIDSFCKGEIYTCGNTKKGNFIKNIEDARKILVIEDSVNTGSSIENAKLKIKNSKYGGEKCLFGGIYVTSSSKKYIDLFFEICSQPRIFEWNYIHHNDCKNMCFDIDGVLCEDPTEEQNDDGPLYLDFIRSAKQKFKPTAHIGCLVTTRLEKYRNETELRLKNHNISYGKLIMLNLSTKEERIKLDMHGKFKGDVYKKQKDSLLFIESDINQALEIAKISKKPVFCTQNSQFIDGGVLENTKQVLKYHIFNNGFVGWMCKVTPDSIKRIIKNILKFK